jgi:hypothetical protein
METQLPTRPLVLWDGGLPDSPSPIGEDRLVAAAEEIIAAYIQANGPFLFHVTSLATAGAVVTAGMYPGDSFEQRPFFESRRDRVYLSSLARTPLVVLDRPRAILRVDIRGLQPDRFDTDEDQAQSAYLRGSPWVSVTPPRRDEAIEEQQRGALREWADTTPHFDAPEVVEQSLAAGSVAYRGAIPAELVSEAQERSVGAEAFVRAAEAKLELDRGTLGPIPLLGDQHVEAARGYAMATTVLEGAIRRPLAADLSEDFASRAVARGLMQEARGLMEEGEMDRGVVLMCASSLADRAEGFCLALSDFDRINVFVELVEPAVELLGAIAYHVDAEAAREIANRTLSAIQLAAP